MPRTERPTPPPPRPDLATMVRWAEQQGSRSRSPFASWLLALYRVPRLRRLARGLAWRLEGKAFHSATLREMARRFHGVEVGAYTCGAWWRPGHLPRGTRVGRYSSVSSVMRVYRRNHPFDRPSTHPFFYRADVGPLDADSIQLETDNPLTIGNDVWIGHEVVILPGCQVIGDGAVVGAGSVVTRDVEPYCVVAGNPARVVRRRFAPDVEVVIRRSRWWERSLSEVICQMDAFVLPATPASVRGLLEGASDALRYADAGEASARRPVRA